MTQDEHKVPGLAQRVVKGKVNEANCWSFHWAYPKVMLCNQTRKLKTALNTFSEELDSVPSAVTKHRCIVEVKLLHHLTVPTAGDGLQDASGTITKVFN